MTNRQKITSVLALYVEGLAISVLHRAKVMYHYSDRHIDCARLSALGDDWESGIHRFARMQATLDKTRKVYDNAMQVYEERNEQ